MYPYAESLYRAVIIATIIIGTIITSFVLSIIWSRRRYRLLSDEKIREQLDTLEDERKKIAGDIHDESGPFLSAIKLTLETLESFSEADKLRLQKCIDLMDELIGRIRHLSNGLMSNTLIQLGLLPAVEEFIDMIQNLSGVKIEFHMHDVPEIKTPASIHVFRIIQEIIHNTVKHAKAQNLKIEMFIKKNRLLLLSTDDGCGFNFNAKKKAGLGLNTIQYRVTLLEGMLQRRSAIGKGTAYHIDIPLSAIIK